MVEIALTDINDNAPQITNLPSEVTITENRVNANLFKLNVSVNLSLLTNILQPRVDLPFVPKPSSQNDSDGVTYYFK